MQEQLDEGVRNSVQSSRNAVRSLPGESKQNLRRKVAVLSRLEIWGGLVLLGGRNRTRCIMHRDPKSNYRLTMPFRRFRGFNPMDSRCASTPACGAHREISGCGATRCYSNTERSRSCTMAHATAAASAKFTSVKFVRLIWFSISV